MSGHVIWITGLSGTGKSAVAWAISNKLQAYDEPHIVLDGDSMRSILPWKIGYTRQERNQLSVFYSNLCSELCRQNITVICATISLFHSIHKRNRSTISSYFEVFLRVPQSELEYRNTKGIYGKDATLTDNVVGVDILPEFPLYPDLVIDNYGNVSPQNACDLILHNLPGDWFTWLSKNFGYK